MPPGFRRRTRKAPGEIVSASGTVSVGTIDRQVCVRVNGRGSFQTSTGLKDFFKRMIARGYRDFVVDLNPCELMDSTFMGTLAGAALRLREIGEGGLRIVNANPRNRDLLAGLGLDHLFEVTAGAAPEVEPARLTQVRQDGTSDAKETVLEAHQALAAADASNAVKFQDVIEFLKREVGEGG